MKKVVLYSDFSEKKNIVSEPVTRTALESLIYCLDVLDFNAALSVSNNSSIKDTTYNGIEWIELSFLKK